MAAEQKDYSRPISWVAAAGVVLVLLCQMAATAAFAPHIMNIQPELAARHRQMLTATRLAENSEAVDDDEETDIDFLFEEEEPPLDALEKVWRFAKKPLLHIGSKGATHSHGNSLRQLLEDHTVVKAKVNTKKFGSLENAATALTALAVENGAPEGIEVLQIREYGSIILFGLPGTLQRMEDGVFPPQNSSKQTDSEVAP